MNNVLKSVNFDPDNKVAVKLPLFGHAILSEGALQANGEARKPIISEEDTARTIELMLAEAEQQAQALLDQAQSQILQWQEEAKAEGRKAGYLEGQQVAQTEIAETLNTVRSTAQAAIDASNQFIRDNQANMGKLAIAITKKLIAHSLETSPEVVTEAVAQLIEVVNIQGACRIRLNERDHDILKPHWEAVANLQQPGATWELVSDKNIKRGGFLIEVGGGTIDARLETQLAQIEAAFADVADAM